MDAENDPLKVAVELERMSQDGLSGDLHNSGWGAATAHEAEESVRQGAATIRQLLERNKDLDALLAQSVLEIADLRELVGLLQSVWIGYVKPPRVMELKKKLEIV